MVIAIFFLNKQAIKNEILKIKYKEITQVFFKETFLFYLISLFYSLNNAYII